MGGLPGARTALSPTPVAFSWLPQAARFLAVFLHHGFLPATRLLLASLSVLDSLLTHYFVLVCLCVCGSRRPRLDPY